MSQNAYHKRLVDLLVDCSNGYERVIKLNPFNRSRRPMCYSVAMLSEY